MSGARPPPSHAALAALPAIALDLETTGLEVANDRIVQIGAVGRVSSSDAETLVRIHRSLLTLTLDQQLEEFAAGVPPSGRIEVRRLSRSEQRALVRDLRVLDDTLKMLRSSIAR